MQNWIKPQPGNRILDIGCGPGSLIKLLPDVDYVGYDPNPSYIAYAKKQWGDRGHFVCDYLTQISPEDIGKFDAVLLNGVLHHVSDDQAKNILSMAHQALKPKGRLITRDGCYEKNQNFFVRFLLRNDRGAFIRNEEGYAALFRDNFNLVRSEILRKALRLPYSLVHFEAIKKESRNQG